MKLIRDKYWEMFGGKDMRIASDEEFSSFIRKKLSEEVQEFLESDEIEELADVLEVISAIIKDKGCTEEQVQDVRQKKAQEKGDFSKKILWHGKGS